MGRDSCSCPLHLNASLRRCEVYGASEKTVPAAGGQPFDTLDDEWIYFELVEKLRGTVLLLKSPTS